MDTKILAGMLAISLIASVGVVFAMPSWDNSDGNWTGSDSNATGNFTGPPGHGFGHGRAMRDNAMNWTGQGFNSTGDFMYQPCPGPNPKRNQTGPQFNSTQTDEFKQAIETGDYQTAKQLHEAYNLGGPLFDKLTETTFAKYVQIHLLQNELRKELGLEEKPGFGPGFDGAMFGSGQGFARGMGNCVGYRAPKPVADSEEKG